MKPSIVEVLRRIKPLARAHQIAHLRGVIACEPKRGIRRAELELELKHILNKQLKTEIRRERLAS